jgi:hypothetical protein
MAVNPAAYPVQAFRVDPTPDPDSELIPGGGFLKAWSPEGLGDALEWAGDYQLAHPDETVVVKDFMARKRPGQQHSSYLVQAWGPKAEEQE